MRARGREDRQTGAGLFTWAWTHWRGGRGGGAKMTTRTLNSRLHIIVVIWTELDNNSSAVRPSISLDSRRHLHAHIHTHIHTTPPAVSSSCSHSHSSSLFFTLKYNPDRALLALFPLLIHPAPLFTLFLSLFTPPSFHPLRSLTSFRSSSYSTSLRATTPQLYKFAVCHMSSPC